MEYIVDWEVYYLNVSNVIWLMAESAVPPAKRHYPRLLCSHCNCYVSKSTWYNHRCLTVQGGSVTDNRVGGKQESSQRRNVSYVCYIIVSILFVCGKSRYFLTV